MYLAKFSSTSGDHLWSKRFGGFLADEAVSVAVDSNDRVVLAGSFSGSSSFGGSTFSSSGIATFVAVYTSNGTHVWSRASSGNGNHYPMEVAVDRNSGEVVVGGYFNYDADFGNGLLPNAGSYDIFLVEYSANGVLLAADSMGGSGSDLANALTVHADGGLIASGYFQGTASFDGVSMTSAGGLDAFLIKR